MASYVLVADWRESMTGCEATEIRPPVVMSAQAARAQAAAWAGTLAKDGFDRIVVRIETADGAQLDWCVVDGAGNAAWQNVAV